MKKFYSSVVAIIMIFIATINLNSQTAEVLKRPSHVDISAADSRGAVLVRLSGYTTDDVRYRLYNGTVQHDCWDAVSGTFVTSNSYALGPLAVGTPTTATSFWIPYLRATNISTAASYRDRLGPAFSSNFKTVALPSATEITSPFSLSGNLESGAGLPLSLKYIILAYSGTNLVSASHSDITTGAFAVTCPQGTTIDKVEVRTIIDELVGSKTGTWSTTTEIGSIYLAFAVNVNLSDLKVDNVSISGFSSTKTDYTLNLPAGTTTVPVVTATAFDPAATVVVTPAADLAGVPTARTTTIIVTGSDGTTKKTYTVRFDPLLEFSSIAALRAGATEYDRLHKLTSEAILTAQKVETTRNTYFIEDNTAAIRIDDPTPVKINAEYNLGDGITGLKGTFSVYGGMLQFVPVEDPGAATSFGNVITPQKLTIAEFKTNIANYDAELVMFEDVTFVDAGGTFADKANYNITNGGETTVLRTEFPGVFTGNTIPTIANVTGVTIVYNGTAQIAPRILEDIGVATDVSVAGASAIKVYPVPVGSVLNIEGIDSFTGIEIRDISGKVYYSSASNDAWSVRIETGNMPKGVYFIKLTSPAGNVIRKFVKN